jgi:hypothetical protein
MRSDWLPGTSDLSGMGRHGCLVESRSPAEGDVRCAGRRVDLKRTGRRASGGRGILLREAAPPLRAGGAGGGRRELVGRLQNQPLRRQEPAIPCCRSSEESRLWRG